MAVNPAFVINTWQDSQQLARLLSQLRLNYPDAWVGVISDGDTGSHLDFAAHFCTVFKAEFLMGDRLKLPQFGAAWLERYLRFGQGKGDPLIKLDPDSSMLRAFRYFPEADLSGHLTCLVSQRLELIRGGCIAYSQPAVARLLESGLLADPCYKDPAYYAYRRYSEFAFPGEQRSERLIWSENPCIAHLAKRLTLSQAPWHEVYCAFREKILLRKLIQSGDFAVIHPAR